ncbi:MAG: response regulator [Gemmatimonadaceae bacterium]
MPELVKILVAGLPASLVREIALRLAGVTVSEFEGSQQMGRAASQGEARLVILSDTLPAEESIYVVRRARDASDEVRVAFCISMAEAEAAIRSLKEITVDRFFLAPVDVDEMLREVGRICGVEVLPPQAAHNEHIAAAMREAWDRTRGPTLQKIDKLDDAAIALLDDSLTPEIRAAAQLEAQTISDLVARFGFQSGSSVAQELADRFSNPSLSAVDGVSISEQLLALRQHLSGLPQKPAAPDRSREESGLVPAQVIQPLPDELAHEGTRVLAVDDEALITRGLTSMLGRRKIVVTPLNDPLRFWTVLAETKPNLVLLDFEMPRLSGTELCRALRSDRRWAELPVIFLTGHTDHESIRRVFASGADDYVGKPFVPAELMMRIESRLTGVKARRAPVETDPVTGLPTGGKASDLIQKFLRLARRKTDPYSVAVLEVDEFAALGEKHGRGVAEIVLRSIGEMMQKSFRGEDVVGWWGGPEFIVGMYGSPKEQAAIKLTQICDKIAEQSFTTDAGATVLVHCTGGVSQYQIDGDDVNAMRETALKALQEARASGVNRVGISGLKSTSAMTRRVDVAIVDDDAAMVQLLRHAMESRSMSVATYSDGETAADALTGSAREVQAAVILLGVDLPGINGLEVLRRLKAVELTRVSRVVMLTARTGERDVLAALELGAIDHIAKPFSVPVLVHKVRMALRQTQA